MTAGDEPDRELRVVIVDDSDVVRMKMKSVFEGAGLSVVGDAPNGESGVLLVGEVEPDVVVMDLEMPGMSGIEATWKIGGFAPHLPVLVLTVSDNGDDIADAVFAGAKGYIVKGAPDGEIVAAVRAVAAGQTVISNDVAGKLVRRGSGREEQAEPGAAETAGPAPAAPPSPPAPPMPPVEPETAQPQPQPQSQPQPAAPPPQFAAYEPAPEPEPSGNPSLFKLGVITLVGVLLTALNQGPEIARADTDAGTWALAALNFVVVFAVWELATGPLNRGSGER